MSEVEDAYTMRTALRRIASELELVIHRHEEIVHAGKWCVEERANTVAFLAHRLGVRDSDSLAVFLEALERYELFHEEHES